MTARTKTDSHESAAVSVATKTFRVLVFGKVGCDKCAMLNRRLDRLFAEESWQDFEKQYCDIETEEGLIAFCRAQCVNPSRIPALLVTRRQAPGVVDHGGLSQRGIDRRQRRGHGVAHEAPRASCSTASIMAGVIRPWPASL